MPVGGLCRYLGTLFVAEYQPMSLDYRQLRLFWGLPRAAGGLQLQAC